MGNLINQFLSISRVEIKYQLSSNFTPRFLRTEEMLTNSHPRLPTKTSSASSKNPEDISWLQMHGSTFLATSPRRLSLILNQRTPTSIFPIWPRMLFLSSMDHAFHPPRVKR